MRYVQDVLWIFLTLACSSPEPVPQPDPGPTPQEHADAVSQGLGAALVLWQAGEFTEAQDQVHDTYRVHFAPLAQELVTHAPQRQSESLALEYRFGQLGWQMRRAGDEQEMMDAVEDLRVSVVSIATSLSTGDDNPVQSNP